MIKRTAGYNAILDFYGERRAERSKVLLMDHIHQGIEILRRIGASELTMEAYAVHPLFQADIDLAENYPKAAFLKPEVVILAIEYRNVANRFLADKIVREEAPARVWDDVLKTYVHPTVNYTIRPLHDIILSPIESVNHMLIADKVQNRKDFLAYHFGTHARSDELDLYFKLWLECLGVSEEQYQTLIKDLEHADVVAPG